MNTAHSTRDGAIIHLACSRGGHFDLLLRHQEPFEGLRVVWVTQHSGRAERLRRDGADVHVLGEWDRVSLWRRALQTSWRSLGLVLRERPRMVVTSGSGIVVPFCVMARLAGARVMFVETAARVRGPSKSGRVLARVAHHVIAQWSEMQSVYRGATIARGSVVEELATGPRPDGTGTLVVVGTHSQPFDRLLRMVRRGVESGLLPEPVTVQAGPSQESLDRAEMHELMTPEQMETAIRRARHVVCHAGTGTIATALRAGRRPLVLARLAHHHEHFDDHQQQIVDKLAALDLVVPLGEEITAADLARAARPLVLAPELERLPPLVDCLRQGVEAALLAGRPSGQADGETPGRAV